MINLSKTTLLSILLAVFVIAAGVFVYQWWQTKEEFPEGEPEKEAVTITTDKTEYEQGETVEITVRNGLDKPIWYIKEICSPSCCGLYKLENDEWKFLKVPFPCVVFTYPGGTIRPDRLNPGEEIKKQLDTKARSEFVKNGKYRFSFYYGLTKDSYTEKTIYSNDFTIK